jgi:type VI secretion system protein ImpK
MGAPLKDTERGSSSAPRSRSRDSLVLLYQGVFGAIARLQAGRKTLNDATSFRRKMKAALADVERHATALNCDFQDIQDAHLAVVSLLDEVILGSSDPAKAEWGRFPLAHDLMGQPVAGEVFFERLEGLLRSRKDSNQLADVLEVYLICLLLGFEGRYAGAGRAELLGLAERTRGRIYAIRPRSSLLSPDGGLPDEILPPAVEVRQTNRLLWSGLSAIAVGSILFLVFKFHLLWFGNHVVRALAGV